MASFNPSVVINLATEKAEDSHWIPDYARLSILSTVDAHGYPIIRGNKEAVIPPESLSKTIVDDEMNEAISSSFDLLLYAVDHKLNASDAFRELVRARAEQVISEAKNMAPAVSSDAVRVEMIRSIISMQNVSPTELLEAAQEAITRKSVREVIEAKSDGQDMSLNLLWAEDGSMQRHLVLDKEIGSDGFIFTASKAGGIQSVSASEVMPTGGRAEWATPAYVKRRAIEKSDWDGSPAWAYSEESGVAIIARPASEGSVMGDYDYVVGWSEKSGEKFTPNLEGEVFIAPVTGL